ncbi:hypothetical protein V8G54_032069 [Vigna mungo]|uniref:Serine-threonine/tyrosine-protein kinase catalytic domain-containing protein n=1 Tax=Vigna mungo TaxID=3915 RepID=A0AAQ3RGC8_VIGMU
MDVAASATTPLSTVLSVLAPKKPPPSGRTTTTLPLLLRVRGRRIHPLQHIQAIRAAPSRRLSDHESRSHRDDCVRADDLPPPWEPLNWNTRMKIASDVAKGLNHVSTGKYAVTGNLTPECNVYGLGVVLLELISGRKAIDSPETCHLVDWVIVIAAMCLHEKADRRPTIREVVFALTNMES